MITGIAHINLTVPSGTLHLSDKFYGETLGLTSTPCPEHMRGRLSWFNIGKSGQQVHIAFGTNEPSDRHPCFKLESPEALMKLRGRIMEHHQLGDEAAPLEAPREGHDERNGMLP